MLEFRFVVDKPPRPHQQSLPVTKSLETIGFDDVSWDDGSKSKTKRNRSKAYYTAISVQQDHDMIMLMLKPPVVSEICPAPYKGKIHSAFGYTPWIAACSVSQSRHLWIGTPTFDDVGPHYHVPESFEQERIGGLEFHGRVSKLDV